MSLTKWVFYMSSYHIESNFIPGSRKFLETLFGPLGEQKTKPQLFNSNASWLRCFLQVALWRKPPRADSLSRQEHLGMPRARLPTAAGNRNSQPFSCNRLFNWESTFGLMHWHMWFIMIYLKSVCKGLFLNFLQSKSWKARCDFQISFSWFELVLSEYLWAGEVLCWTLCVEDAEAFFQQ